MQKQLADFTELKKGAGILNVLEHPLRMQMLKFIHKKGAATVTEIYIALRTEQTIVSSQLRILREAGLVTTKRQGKYIYYSVLHSRIERVDTLIRNFLQNSFKNYIQEFSVFAKDGLNEFKIEPIETTPDGIENWLQNMGKGLKAYHNNLMKKAAELTQEARKMGKPDTYFSKAEVSKIVSEGLKQFLKRYTV